MSQETALWLNTKVLIGQAENRKAWHFNPDLQGDESNHYNGFIPVGDVVRRLFDWEPITIDEPTFSGLNPDGSFYVVKAHNKRVMLRPPGTLGPDDEGDEIGYHTTGRAHHPYKEWLLEALSNIMGDTLGINSAGLLDGGRKAWVQVTVPENVTTPEGVEFRPLLLAATSIDASWASLYKRVITDAVCDNTTAAALAESDAGTFKVKHTRHSMSTLKVKEIRDSLQMIHAMEEEFMKQVALLTSIPVTDSQWAQVCEFIAPTTEVAGDKNAPKLEGRGLTMAINKQEALSTLWKADPRVTPWKNTAWGVKQAVNTWAHHVQTVRGNDRQGRNMIAAIEGKFDTLDFNTMDVLQKVLTNA